MSTMEPTGPVGRQAGVTPDRSHDAHEPLDIAAFAAGDLEGPDRERIRLLVESCGDCRALHADLVAIAGVTRSTPPALPRRTADFRLTDADVARLASPVQRLRAWLAGPRGAMTTPIAAGLATLGIAAILISNVPLSPTVADDAAAPAAAPSDRLTASSPAEAQPLASSDVRGAAGGVDEGDPTTSQASPPTLGPQATDSVKAAPSEPSDEGSVDQYRDGTAELALDADDSASPLLVIGIALLGAAIVVVALRPLARLLR
jgi:hypothetical protein